MSHYEERLQEDLDRIKAFAVRRIGNDAAELPLARKFGKRPLLKVDVIADAGRLGIPSRE